MKTPYVSLFLGGADLVARWGPLLIDVTVTDERGLEADKLAVTLDDQDGRIVYPETGARIVVEGGYRETGAAVVGEFVVDQISLEGWKQTIQIQASSVEAKAKNKERRAETHKASETPTLGDLIEKIAGRNGLTPAVAGALRAIPIEEAEHQTEESDLAFINRLVMRHDGMMAVKQGRLVAIERGSMTTASGAPVAPVVIAPGLGLKSYRVTWKDKPVHGKVEARYFDRGRAEPVKIEIPVDPSKAEGAEEIVARLREPFPTEAEARRAAEARARELKRGDGSASFVVELDPTIGAEIPILAQGIRAGVNGLWVPTRVEHSWRTSGAETRIEAETPGSDSRDEDDA